MFSFLVSLKLDCSQATSFVWTSDTRSLLLSMTIVVTFIEVASFLALTLRALAAEPLTSPGLLRLCFDGEVGALRIPPGKAAALLLAYLSFLSGDDFWLA